MKEYEELREGVLDRLKELWSLEKFALGGAAAIASWLFVHADTIKAVPAAWWLPSAFLILCAVRFGTGMYHLGYRAATHLIKIEQHYLGEPGGWEAWFQRQRSNETWAYSLAWCAAIAAASALPFLVPR